MNPNAKSFVPLQTPVRPTSPVSDGSFYYPPNVAPVSHMQGMPVGIGVSFYMTMAVGIRVLFCSVFYIGDNQAGWGQVG